jgi:hypothetical protein
MEASGISLRNIILTVIRCRHFVAADEAVLRYGKKSPFMSDSHLLCVFYTSCHFQRAGLDLLTSPPTPHSSHLLLTDW